jgi:hypothetical protein
LSGASLCALLSYGSAPTPPISISIPGAFRSSTRRRRRARLWLPARDQGTGTLAGHAHRDLLRGISGPLGPAPPGIKPAPRGLRLGASTRPEGAGTLAWERTRAAGTSNPHPTKGGPRPRLRDGLGVVGGGKCCGVLPYMGAGPRPPPTGGGSSDGPPPAGGGVCIRWSLGLGGRGGVRVLKVLLFLHGPCRACTNVAESDRKLEFEARPHLEIIAFFAFGFNLTQARAAPLRPLTLSCPPEEPIHPPRSCGINLDPARPAIYLRVNRANNESRST